MNGFHNGAFNNGVTGHEKESIKNKRGDAEGRRDEGKGGDERGGDQEEAHGPAEAAAIAELAEERIADGGGEEDGADGDAGLGEGEIFGLLEEERRKAS